MSGQEGLRVKISKKLNPVNLIFSFVFITLGVVMIVPALWMVSTSFKSEGQIWANPIVWIPKPFTMVNFQNVFSTIPIFRYLLNSLIVAVSITVLQLFFSSLAAYGFARIRFKGSTVLFSLFLGTMMIPQNILIIPLYRIMVAMHLLNTYFSLILPNMVTAFSIFLLRQFFYGIPKELDEAAVLDGCNRIRILFRIIMPLSLPVLSALTIFIFMNSWNDFMWPLISISSDSMRTMQVGLAYFSQGNTTFWGPYMGAATIATIPILIVFLVAQKKFIQGIAMSGIKG